MRVKDLEKFEDQVTLQKIRNRQARHKIKQQAQTEALLESLNSQNHILSRNNMLLRKLFKEITRGMPKDEREAVEARLKEISGEEEAADEG